MIIPAKHGCDSKATTPAPTPDMQRCAMWPSTWLHTHLWRVFFFFFLLGSKQGPNRMISSVLVGKIIPGRYQTTLFIVSFFCISSSSLSLCSTNLLSLRECLVRDFKQRFSVFKQYTCIFTHLFTHIYFKKI